MSSVKHPTVLIVDDNDMMRAILRGILRNEDYNVVGEARNGVSAIEMTERFKPQIICLDVMMPEKDGLAALPEIRKAAPEATIVMITANADAATVQGAISQGASGFIVKPFNAGKVLESLARHRH